MGTPRWGFEVRTRDGWSADAAGAQDASNCFATREEAEEGVAELAEALDVEAEDIRVVDLSSPGDDARTTVLPPIRVSPAELAARKAAAAAAGLSLSEWVRRQTA